MTVSTEHRMRVLHHLEQSQRIRAIAPIGSLLKRPGETQVARRYSMGRSTHQDPSHLDAIRAMPCLRCGLEPCGEAAHVRLNCAALGKRTGIGERPDSRWTVPLCGSCHRIDPDSQHKVGEIAFWNALGINPLRAAMALYRASPDLVAMRAVALLFIAERR